MRSNTVSVSKLIQLIFLGLAGLAIAACTDTRGGSIPYNVSDFGAPDSPTPQALASDDKLAPMDTLTIRVFGLADLSGDYQVDLLGNVAMPLIGDVAAIDLTPAQLDQRLTEKFGQKYLQNPDISVGIKSSAGRFVTVDGAVKKGGAYPVLGKITLMQAVALAGGTDEHANQRRVAIFRTIGGERQAAAFDLLSIRHGEMPDPPVYSGDIVVVDGSNLKEAQKKFFQSIPLFAIFSPI
jgi:polysaccharide export outer membrane protein